MECHMYTSLLRRPKTIRRAIIHLNGRAPRVSRLVASLCPARRVLVLRAQSRFAAFFVAAGTARRIAPENRTTALENRYSGVAATQPNRVFRNGRALC